MTATASPVQIREPRTGYLRVTFHNPPINLFDPDVFAALRLLLERLEGDEEVRVVVLDSSDADYWISHLDVHRLYEVPEIPGAANLAEEWHRFVTGLAHLPVVSIASIRGRARGIGNELALACDLRFASREKAIVAQPEVGFGVPPGGGALDWLPALVGRSRAIEIIASADDYDADTAERYGWINRAVPDVELDEFVDALANRIAGWHRPAIASAKRIINERTAPPSEGDLLQSFSAILQAVGWPEARSRMAAMEERGWGKATEVELHHPLHLRRLAEELSGSTEA
jgi:enoyl-CoA hydratase/carnithine racemase